MNDDRFVDLLRESRKAEDTLIAVWRHFGAAAEANAALHMNPNVRPNPLAAAVAATLESLGAVLTDLVREDEDG